MTTALAAAMADHTPVLAISGEVARSWEGMGGFQDASGAGIDDIDALKRVTGLSLSLSSRAVVPHHLRHAITHAFARRSPVHLSVPVDVQKAEIASDSIMFEDDAVMRQVQAWQRDSLLRELRSIYRDEQATNPISQGWIVSTVPAL